MLYYQLKFESIVGYLPGKVHQPYISSGMLGQLVEKKATRNFQKPWFEPGR